MNLEELFKLEVEQLSLQEGRSLKGGSKSEGGDWCLNTDSCSTDSGGACANGDC